MVLKRYMGITTARSRSPRSVSVSPTDRMVLKHGVQHIHDYNLSFSIPYGSNGVEAVSTGMVGLHYRMRFQYPLRIEWC